MKWLKLLFTLYMMACLGLYLIQDSLIFDGHPYPESQSYSQGEEVEIPLTDELSMNCLLIKAKAGTRSKGVFLYLHGNKGNIRGSVYQCRKLLNRGLDIFIIDYRGYGKTEGSPVNDRQVLEDANKAYAYLKQHYEEKNIYVIGYSLGTGMASYIASQNTPAQLILVAPFTSLTDIKNSFLWMFPDFLLKYKLDNERHLANTDVPVTIIHGTEDQVVDYGFSQKLKVRYPEIELVSVSGQSHRGIIFDPGLKTILDKVVHIK